MFREAGVTETEHENSSLKPGQRDGESWAVASEGYRYSGEVTVVFNLVLTRARISPFLYLFPYRQFRKSDCLNRQDQDLLFPAKLQHNTEGNQTHLCTLIQVLLEEIFKVNHPHTPPSRGGLKHLYPSHCPSVANFNLSVHI